MRSKAESDEISAVAAARRLCIGLDYVYVLLRSGKLAGHKVGRQWLVSTEAVEERLQRISSRMGSQQ